jgi:hypothetical protein
MRTIASSISSPRWAMSSGDLSSATFPHDVRVKGFVLGFILAFVFLAAIGKAKGEFKQVPRWWIPQALCVHRYEGSWRVGPMVRAVSPDLDVRPARQPLILGLMRGGERPRAPDCGSGAPAPLPHHPCAVTPAATNV